MTESYSPVEETIDQSKRLALRRMARYAQQAYFRNEARKEYSEGDPFDIFPSEIPSGVLRAVTSTVNSRLRGGDMAAIIDFPYDEKIRVQILNRNHYARYLSPYDWGRQLEDIRTGNFSLSLGKSPDRRDEEELHLDVKDDHGTKRVFRSEWHNNKDPRLRFAVMTRGQSGWQVMLDFRLLPEEGNAAWKVNAVSYSR
jgi:hypothetical protein